MTIDIISLFKKYLRHISLVGIVFFGLFSSSYAWTSAPFDAYGNDMFLQCFNRPRCDPDYDFQNNFTTVMTLQNIVATVNYGTDIFNVTKNQPVGEGSTVNVGNVIRFQPAPFQDSDISWVGTGGYNDSPYGKWGIDGTANIFFMNDPFTAAGSVDLYASLQITPPSVSFTNTGTASLSNCSTSGNTTTCTVASAGSIGAKFTFAPTTGKIYGQFHSSHAQDFSKNFYYGPGYHYVGPLQDQAKLVASGCDGQVTERDNILNGPSDRCLAMREDNAYILNVPAVPITVNITAATAATVNIHFSLLDAFKSIFAKTNEYFGTFAHSDAALFLSTVFAGTRK